MIEELAVVTAINGSTVTVKSEVKSGCSGCQQVDSCASGQVANAIPQLKLEVELKMTEPVEVGDKVVIGLTEKNLLNSAAQVYLFPLFGLLFFSGLGNYLYVNGVLPHELLALLVGVAGSLLGYVFAKFSLTRAKHKHDLKPILLRKACNL